MNQNREILDLTIIEPAKPVRGSGKELLSMLKNTMYDILTAEKVQESQSANIMALQNMNVKMSRSTEQQGVHILYAPNQTIIIYNTLAVNALRVIDSLQHHVSDNGDEKEEIDHIQEACNLYADKHMTLADFKELMDQKYTDIVVSRQGDIPKAAKFLGLGKQYLYKKLKRLKEKNNE